jgi:hypothetical protein
MNYAQIEGQNILNELKRLDFMMIPKIQPKNNCNLIHFLLASRQVDQHKLTHSCNIIIEIVQKLSSTRPYLS